MKKLLLIVAVGALVAASFIFDVRGLLQQSLQWVESLGAWAPLIFIGIYILCTVLLVPGSVLTAGAGTLFGVVQGSVVVSIASTIGATLAFLIGRYGARDWVEAKVKSNASFAAVDKAVAKEGWFIVALTRLSPLFPFTLLNYAYGLTPVRLWHYVLASWISMMPGTVMYVYLGSLARASGESRSPLQWALYGLGLAATVVVTVVITRLAKKALKQRTQTSEPDPAL